MGLYFKAENLKLKRTFVRKLVLLAPVATLLLALVLASEWLQINAFNWWYILILPGYIALLCTLSDQKESQKLKYRAILSLPISLKKNWIGKNLTLIFYMALSHLVLLIGILLGGSIVPNPLLIKSIFIGIALIFITSLWQIPLCLFLSRKIGMVGTILFQVGVGDMLGILFASKSLWWLCPYNWTARMIPPILGILPNGTLAQSGDPMLNAASIPIAIILSLLLFALLLLATAIWYPRQEVK
ncbi:lantibiotic immunity ABC transporter MutE/EpiE family permease subunit [Scatolibacter rhodanostii]|uniref:lantibiotic immunity ABC transporter MutE/EpiE family permease subunit n=1 Tax=Scatolibacter rhodanostii TaxID=2014781 RepID=UPI000C077109|nr:lantibiotic immunity ABC transporter MutE/EpiE family permease subunit [Scatolibacter rhodanostii]